MNIARTRNAVHLSQVKEFCVKPLAELFDDPG